MTNNVVHANGVEVINGTLPLTEEQAKLFEEMNAKKQEEKKNKPE